ncbi:MAG: 3-hexulose-6-phosphate synthase [Planctomycetota bacterium]
MLNAPFPVLQVALDFLDISRALRAAKEAHAGGAQWLEAGTPLIKAEGLAAVRALRAEFPQATVVADLKTMDAGRTEMEAAAKAGANVGVVLGLASDATIAECVEAGRNYGLTIGCDLIGVADPAARAAAVEKLGVDYVNVHCPIDEQMEGKTPWDRLKEVAARVKIPISVAGGISAATAGQAVQFGARIVVVGGAITKSPDGQAAAAAIRAAMAGQKVDAPQFKRVGRDEVLKALKQVSAANLSDAMHRGGVLPGIHPVKPGLRFAGPAYTCRSMPGDWSKPVRAIDEAQPGDVLVIDSFGVGPAVWGELATHSAMKRGLAGVVIHGASRDTGDIRALNFPLFSLLQMPNAGEPKGFGELAVPLHFLGREIHPGDWLLGDDDGVVVVPQAQAAEWANRALDVLEKENRLRADIDAGSSLGKVAELLKWEKV